MTTLMTDGRCVEQVLAGDLEGYGELHRRYFEPTVRLVAGILNGDRAVAEDTVQEAFLSALEALPRLSDGDRFFPWLKRIAVNRAIEVRRHRQRKERLHRSWSSQVSGSGSGGWPDMEQSVPARSGKRLKIKLRVRRRWRHWCGPTC